MAASFRNSSRALRIILLLHVGEAHVEVDKRKLGICRSGRLKFRKSGVVLVEIQMRLADKKMVFGRAVAEF